MSGFLHDLHSREQHWFKSLSPQTRRLAIWCSSFSTACAITVVFVTALLVFVELVNVARGEWTCLLAWFDMVNILCSLSMSGVAFYLTPAFVVSFDGFGFAMRSACGLAFVGGLQYSLPVLYSVIGVWFLDVVAAYGVCVVFLFARRAAAFGHPAARWLVWPMCMLECFTLGHWMSFVFPLARSYAVCKMSALSGAPD